MEDFSRHWKSKSWMDGEYGNEDYDFNSQRVENTDHGYILNISKVILQE